MAGLYMLGPTASTTRLSIEGRRSSYSPPSPCAMFRVKQSLQGALRPWAGRWAGPTLSLGFSGRVKKRRLTLTPGGWSLDKPVVVSCHHSLPSLYHSLLSRDHSLSSRYHSLPSRYHSLSSLYHLYHPVTTRYHPITTRCHPVITHY